MGYNSDLGLNDMIVNLFSSFFFFKFGYISNEYLES